MATYSQKTYRVNQTNSMSYTEIQADFSRKFSLAPGERPRTLPKPTRNQRVVREEPHRCIVTVRSAGGEVSQELSESGLVPQHCVDGAGRWSAGLGGGRLDVVCLQVLDRRLEPAHVVCVARLTRIDDELDASLDGEPGGAGGGATAPPSRQLVPSGEPGELSADRAREVLSHGRPGKPNRARPRLIGKDRQNNPPICVVGGVTVWSRMRGRCRVRCRCERRRFAVEVTRFCTAGNDGSVSGRGWAAGQQVRRSVAAARRWAQSGDGQ